MAQQEPPQSDVQLDTQDCVVVGFSVNPSMNILVHIQVKL